MRPTLPTIPEPHDSDNEDVHWALSAAGSMWERGERSEALKWLRRASSSAAELDFDERAVELAKAAADVATRIESEPPPAPSKPAGRARRPRPLGSLHDVAPKTPKAPSARPSTPAPRPSTPAPRPSTAQAPRPRRSSAPIQLRPPRPTRTPAVTPIRPRRPAPRLRAVASTPTPISSVPGRAAARASAPSSPARASRLESSPTDPAFDVGSAAPALRTFPKATRDDEDTCVTRDTKLRRALLAIDPDYAERVDLDESSYDSEIHGPLADADASGARPKSDPTPSTDLEPEPLTSPRGSLSLQAPAAPQPSTPALPAGMMPAMRVAILPIPEEGDVRLLFLPPGAEPPPGVAVAMLVPPTAEDAARLLEVYATTDAKL